MHAIRIFAILPAVLAFTACEKIIDVELREAPSQLTIEASITNQPGPYYVKLSRTIGFQDPNNFPPVTQAVITISDNIGNEDVLEEVSPGLYQTDSTEGIIGRSYRLIVRTEGKEYTASSTMPEQVELRDVTIEEGGFVGETENDVVVWFQDALGMKNHYRFVAWKNDLPFNRAYVFEDKGYDGEYLRYSFEPDEDNEALKIASQDKVTVEMQGVDDDVYLYFLTLSQHTGEGPPTAPANPISNISGGALGYFSAHTISRKSIIVE
jgi:hypothetical protein